MRKSRPIDSSKLLERLETKHQQLKSRVRELDERMCLTPHEQTERTQLKKQKLAMKDALLTLRPSPGP